MPWYERTEGDEPEVVVLEARGTTIWERTARGKGRGNVRFLEELDSEEAAEERLQQLCVTLEEAGYKLIDPSASVDQAHPTGCAPAVRASVDELPGLLSRQLDSLGEGPTVAEVIAGFERVIGGPGGFEMRNFWFEVGVPEDDPTVVQVAILVQVASDEAPWREIGYHLVVAAPEETDSMRALVRDEDEGTSVEIFLAEVRMEEVWDILADLPCIIGEVEQRAVE